MAILKSVSSLLNTGVEYTDYTANYLFSVSRSAFKTAIDLYPSASELFAAEAIDYLTSSDSEEGTDLVGILLLPSFVAGLSGVVVGGLGCASYITSKVFTAEKYMVDYIDSQFEVSYTNEKAELTYNETQYDIMELHYHDVSLEISPAVSLLSTPDIMY